MVIGDAELRNVPVLVFSDSQPPWNTKPPGKRGTIGLPVVLALRGIRWTKAGTCEVGSNVAAARGSVNLVFDGLTPVTRAQVLRRPIDLVLDTSADQQNERLSRFPNSVCGSADSTRCFSPRIFSRSRSAMIFSTEISAWTFSARQTK